VSNFLDLDDEASSNLTPERSDLKRLLAKVPVSQAPTRLHPEISDRLAEQHGFASREAPQGPVRFVGGRRQPRGVPAEETRQLSIRMPASLYADFLQFADSKQFTYNEAIRYLLDAVQLK
jgi:hypothetical protein